MNSAQTCNYYGFHLRRKSLLHNLARSSENQETIHKHEKDTILDHNAFVNGKMSAINNTPKDMLVRK